MSDTPQQPPIPLGDVLMAAAVERPEEYAATIGTLLARMLVLTGFEDGLGRVYAAVHCGMPEQAKQHLEAMHAWYRTQAEQSGAPARSSLAEVVTHHVNLYQQAADAFGGNIVQLTQMKPN